MSNKYLLLLSISILSLVPAACDHSRPEEFSDYNASKYERVSINYEIQGTNDTTLVFIHGWNLNLRYWDGQVNLLKSRYKIISLDLAGHGNSGKDRTHWTAESFARDIAYILDREKITKAILIGHSLGGEVALQVLDLAPAKVIGIIGIDTFKDVEFEITEDFVDSFKEHLNKFKRNYPEMSDEYARKNIRTKNRDVINRIVRDYKNADPKIALAIYKNMVPKYEEGKQKLQKLPFKLQLIASDYAPVNEEGLKKYTRLGYEIMWIHDAGHFPMVEQPEQFQRALEAVLQKIRSAPPASP